MGLENSPSTLPLPSSEEWLIKDIFPTGEIHLIGGPSGAGKSTWLIKMIESWQKGLSIFGHESYPVPFIYFSGDRSEAGVRRTFKRIGVDDTKFPIYVPRGADNEASLESILTKILKARPEIKVFFVEGLGSKVPQGKTNDYTIVAKFLKKLTEFCERNKVTIIGVVHSAKTKEGEGYLNPRQRALGSVAWAAFSETIILVEPMKPDNPEDSTRQVLILPRNAKEQAFKLEFDGGQLVPVRKAPKNNEILDKYLATLEPGEIFTNKDAEDFTNLSDSSLRFELKKLIDNGKLAKRKAGEYFKVTSQPIGAFDE